MGDKGPDLLGSYDDTDVDGADTTPGVEGLAKTGNGATDTGWNARQSGVRTSSGWNARDGGQISLARLSSAVRASQNTETPANLLENEWMEWSFDDPTIGSGDFDDEDRPQFMPEEPPPGNETKATTTAAAAMPGLKLHEGDDDEILAAGLGDDELAALSQSSSDSLDIAIDPELLGRAGTIDAIDAIPEDGEDDEGMPDLGDIDDEEDLNNEFDADPEDDEESEEAPEQEMDPDPPSEPEEPPAEPARTPPKSRTIPSIRPGEAAAAAFMADSGAPELAAVNNTGPVSSPSQPAIGAGEVMQESRLAPEGIRFGIRAKAMLVGVLIAVGGMSVFAAAYAADRYLNEGKVVGWLSQKASAAIAAVMGQEQKPEEIAEKPLEEAQPVDEESVSAPVEEPKENMVVDGPVSVDVASNNVAEETDLNEPAQHNYQVNDIGGRVLFRAASNHLKRLKDDGYDVGKKRPIDVILAMIEAEKAALDAEDPAINPDVRRHIVAADKKGLPLKMLAFKRGFGDLSKFEGKVVFPGLGLKKVEEAAAPVVQEVEVKGGWGPAQIARAGLKKNREAYMKAMSQARGSDIKVLSKLGLLYMKQKNKEWATKIAKHNKMGPGYGKRFAEGMVEMPLPEGELELLAQLKDTEYLPEYLKVRFEKAKAMGVQEGETGIDKAGPERKGDSGVKVKIGGPKPSFKLQQ